MLAHDMPLSVACEMSPMRDGVRYLMGGVG